MCAYSNKCMPAPVEWWLILHDGSRLCSCCVHREVVPFFFFLSHILIDLVTKLQECSTQIRVFPLVLSTSPPTKLRHLHLPLSPYLFFGCSLSRCISFSLVTELSVQVIRWFEQKTDYYCHRNQLVTTNRCKGNYWGV